MDDYFGTKVPDPYRWLEDDNSPETKAWVEAQNKVTFGYLEQIPERKAILSRLTKLYDYEKYSAPFRQGGRYFFTYNKGLEPQAKLYWTQGLKGEPKVLLDPNTLSKDGTVALAGLSVTHDGKRIAYALAEAGSDWITWHVRDVASGKDLPDVIRWSKASGASWRRDGSGFYYSRYDAPKPGDALKGINQNHQVFFHKLGTPQAEDVLVYERTDHPDWYLGANVTDDGRWLVISAGKGTDPKTSLFIQDLSKPGAKVEPLLDGHGRELFGHRQRQGHLLRHDRQGRAPLPPGGHPARPCPARPVEDADRGSQGPRRARRRLLRGQPVRGELDARCPHPHHLP